MDAQSRWLPCPQNLEKRFLNPWTGRANVCLWIRITREEPPQRCTRSLVELTHLVAVLVASSSPHYKTCYFYRKGKGLKRKICFLWVINSSENCISAALSEVLLDIFGLYWTDCLPRRFKEARSQALSSALFIFHKRLTSADRWMRTCGRTILVLPHVLIVSEYFYFHPDKMKWCWERAGSVGSYEIQLLYL